MMRYKPLFYFFGAITAIWLLRSVFAGTIGVYSFLAWNLFLAIIPLTLHSTVLWARSRLSGMVRRIVTVFSTAAWLLFLPNAFYLLTDFMHLNPQALVNKRDNENHFAIVYERGDALYILDSLLLVCVTLFGAIVGGIALYQAYRYLRNRFQKPLRLAIIGAVVCMVAVGVYIGRYGRWNSWDALYRPFDVIADLITSLADPATFHRFTIMIVTIVVFQLLCLWAVTYAASFRKIGD